MTDEPESLPQNDLDFLMSLDPLHYADQDIDVIIAYQRKHRQQLEGGVKPKRKAAAPGAKIDLNALLGTVKPAAPKPVTGTSSSGPRRV